MIKYEEKTKMEDYKKRRKRTIFPNRDAKKFRKWEWSWTALIEAMKQRLRIEKDVFIIITGRTG